MEPIIKVGGVPEHFNLPWHWAIEKNRFAQAGLNIAFIEYPTGTGAMCTALHDGSLDVAVVLTEGIVADITRNGGTRLIGAYVDSPLRWGIFTGQSSDIHGLEQLTQATFAISRYGSGSHLMAALWAVEQGCPIVFKVAGDFEALQNAVNTGQASAFMWEYFTSKPAVDQGTIRCLGHYDTPWPCFVIAASERALAHKMPQLQRLLKVIQQTCRDVMAHPDQAQADICTRFGQQAPDVQQWWQNVRWSPTGDISQATLQQVLTALQQVQPLSTLPVSELVAPLAVLVTDSYV